MTALTAPGSTAAPARRPSASRGLARAVLLLHRPALYVWAGLFVALGALLLWLYGPAMDAAAEAWRRYAHCATATCAYDQDALLRYKSYSLYATFAVTFLPFLVAAWSGASLVGREVESGTAHLAWTQSISPARWLAVKLTLPAALITAGTSVLVLLHHQVWARSQGRIDSAKDWSESLTFHANGPTTVAFALCGLVGGALAALALRRSLGALVMAVLGTVAVRIVVGVAMPYLWPTVRTVSSLTNNGPAGGRLALDQGLLTSTGAELPDPHCGSIQDPSCRHLYDRLHAVSYYSDSHPYAHYWPLQLMSTGLTLVITALAAFVAFRLLARRTGTAGKGVRG